MLLKGIKTCVWYCIIKVRKSVYLANYTRILYHHLWKIRKKERKNRYKDSHLFLCCEKKPAKCKEKKREYAYVYLFLCIVHTDMKKYEKVSNISSTLYSFPRMIIQCISTPLYIHVYLWSHTFYTQGPLASFPLPVSRLQHTSFIVLTLIGPLIFKVLKFA